MAELHNYENLSEYLNDEYCLSEKDLPIFVKHYGVTAETFLNGVYLKLSLDNISYWLEKTDGIYYVVEKSDQDMLNSIYRIQEYVKLNYLGISEDEVFIDGWEKTFGQLKNSGTVVYHYTTEEDWNKIQEEGKLNPYYGTGLSNRRTFGIFTSVSPHTYEDGSYGDVCLEINLTKFKQDFNIDELLICPEPEVLENAINILFANALKLDGYSDVFSNASDITSETVIIQHEIPIMYVNRI